VEVVELTLHRLRQWPTYTAWISVLWECGGTLAARAIAEGAVQKILAFIAPKLSVTPQHLLGFGFHDHDRGTVPGTSALVGSDCLVEGYLP